MLSEKTLIFVYNADSDMLPALKNHTSRTASPGQECNLYALTFSPIGMKKEWKRFIHDLGIPAQFLSRNEFITHFHAAGSATYPAAFIQSGKEVQLLIGSDEINRCAELEDLISLVRERLGPSG